MDFFGIGPLELLIVALIAFLVLGPRKMTDMGKRLGKGMKEIRKFRSEFSSALEEGGEELKRTGSEIARSLEEGGKPSPGER